MIRLQFSLPLIVIGFMFLAFLVFNTHQVMAAGKFTIEAKINLQSLTNPAKLKVVASANGDNETKYLTGSDLKSSTASISFEFDQKNDIVTVGSRDEYFVCAYSLDPGTNNMESYSCVEGNIEKPNGKNTITIGSGHEMTLSTGKFQSVNGGDIKNPTVMVLIPLSDRKDVKELKVVAMIKGELHSKTIDAHTLLKKSKDNTIKVPIVFDKIPEIGPIQQGDMLYACVSGDELNPPEGTECEHRHTSHTFSVHNIVAR